MARHSTFKMLTQVRLSALLTCLLIFFTVSSSSESTEPAPLVIPPSQYWEGNDGPWSTFPMQVGTPNTNETRVLVSTAIPNQWTVLAEACSTSTCATSRGNNLFNPNASSTWDQEGIYNLLFEQNLNYTGNGLYGFDTVGLGFANNQGTVVLKNQTVAGIVQPDFWMGYLGINPQPTNFTNLANPIPSLFENLYTRGVIPSLSYSYTAGAKYQLKGVFGSLIFGGMDLSRFEANSMTFNFGEDISRDLLVGVQSWYATENSGKETTMLSEGVLAYIDSTVPWIVMPDEACDEFEQAFGLSVDNATGLYLVSESQHTTLSSRNPNFTFVLGNSASGGSTISISLPYNAFDLTVSAPYVNGTSSYFPLKRGNDSTYTLGRTFLQEAYLTADYKRGNFSVSQCVWNANAKENIQTIHATNWTAPPSSASGSGASSGSSASSSLTTGAIVGIVIAAVVFIAAIAALALLRRFRKWPFHNRPHPRVPELDANGNPIGPMAINPSADNKAPLSEAVEADSKDNLHGHYRPELQGSSGDVNKPELVGSGGHPREKNELPGGAVYRMGDRRELYGSDAAGELEGSREVMELAGSPVGPEYYGNSSAVFGSSSRDHSPSGPSELSPRSPTGSASGKHPSPMSPTTRNANLDRRPSPLRQSHSSAGTSGIRPAPMSPMTGPQSPLSQSVSREPSQSRGRGPRSSSSRDPSSSPRDIGMAR